MLSLLFEISFKFSRSSKKVVINSFCCFLLLNYGKKGQSRVTRLMPKASLRLSKNDSRISKKTNTKTIFLFKIWFYNHFLTYSIKIFFFEKSAKNILERNVSAKDDSCCKSNRSIASRRRMEFPMTKLLWTFLVICVTRGRQNRPSPQLKCHQQNWSPRGHILKSLA